MKKVFLVLMSVALLLVLLPGGLVFAAKPAPPDEPLDFNSGFETGTFDDFDNVFGSPMVTTDAAHTGGYGMESDGYGFASKLFVTMQPERVHFWVKVVEYPDETVTIARLNTWQSGAYKGWFSTWLELMPDGRLFTKNHVTETALQLDDHWYMVSFDLWNCWIDEVKEIETRTWTTGDPNIYGVRFGLQAPKGGKIYIDNVTIENVPKERKGGSNNEPKW